MVIRIPAITLDIRSEEGSEAGELNGNALGLGIMATCLLAVLYGNTAQLAAPAHEALLWAFGATVALVAFSGASLDKRFHALFRRFSPVTPVSAGCCAASLALMAAPWLGAAGLAVSIAAGALLGCGTALLMFYWGIAYSRTETPTIVFNTSVSTALAILLYALVVEKLPYPWAHLLVSALPLLNIWLLRYRVTENLPNPDMREATYFSELNIARGSFATKIVPTLLSLGFVFALLLSHAGYCLTPEAGVLGAAYTVLAMVLGCAVVVGGALRVARQDQTFAHLLRTLLPLVALCVLPLPFTDTAEASVGNMLILAAMSMVIMLTWAYLASICQGFRLSPVYVFGVGLGAVVAGMGLAAALRHGAFGVIDAVMTPTTFGLVLCLLGLVVACGLFPRQDDIRAIVERSFTPALLAGDPVWETGGEEAASAPARGERATGKGPEATGRGGEPALRGHAAAGDLSAKGDGATEGGEERRKGRFMRRCDQVADTYLLSRRETDVLYLLAKGRNVGYIKEKLYISEGTAKTHVHHVYKKLNVHSQQELIALIDSVEER